LSNFCERVRSSCLSIQAEAVSEECKPEAEACLLASRTEFQSSGRLQSRAVRQRLDLVNLELDRGLTLAHFCQVRGNLANVEDLRKARAAYDRARVMLGDQKHLRKWQRRWLERKLRRLQRCICDMVIAAPAAEFGAAELALMFPTSPLGQKP
jgi:hypothetical protein